MLLSTIQAFMVKSQFYHTFDQLLLLSNYVVQYIQTNFSTKLLLCISL